jgi:hypothetical protein
MRTEAAALLAALLLCGASALAVEEEKAGDVDRAGGAFGSVVYRGSEIEEVGSRDADLLPPPTIEILDRVGLPARPLGSEVPFAEPIREASLRFGVEESLIEAVILAESGFNPYAVSRAGAIGLMQLMPSTAERFGVEEIFDPRENILGGTCYLSYLLSLYKGDLTLALAAYNAGEHAVDRYGGVPPYRETQGYVRIVKRNLRRLRAREKTPSVAKAAAPRDPRWLLRPSPPATTIYYYLDERGTVHFTNVDPPEGVEEVHVWRKR